MPPQHQLLPTLLVLALAIALTHALHRGDKISSAMQTLHSGWKTSLMDLPIHQMPRFKQRDTAVITAPLPKPDIEDTGADSGAAVKETRIDPANDVKLSLAYLNSKFGIPWIVLYDSQSKKSIEKLKVIFSHDDFNVLGVEYEIIYSKEIQRLDPSHPSLHSFEISYEWSAVEEEDLQTGVLVMFISSLVALCALVAVIVANYDSRLASSGYKRMDNAPPTPKRLRPELSGNGGFSSSKSR